jgi:hypothetical protein
MKMARPPIEERLRNGSVKDSCTGRWNWIGAKSHNGYGWIKVNNVMQKAHRVAFQTFVGPIGEGLLVLHSCDNPQCINPDHLYLGTNAVNSADMVAKRRQFKKISPDDVVRIRSDRRTLRVIAADYGIHHSTVSLIRSGERWKHVK